MNLILGTAGHIDHGKTTLVRALTGIDCDRLDEEKRRGITIELGFAWLDLTDGRRVGIVDVPGHERFVKNMVAGASGIDCVLLVIAADEGVMPQTREHLEICSLLGVRSGLVAITKSDLVDEEWLKFVREDVQNTLAGTFLANAPIIPVSATTGMGLPLLRQEIEKQINSVAPRPKTDLLRLPVDRVFTMKGFGTVITGTLVSGCCALGETVSIFPSGKTARVRSLEVHNAQVEEATAGQRCAMNLQGIEVNEIERGDMAARPGTLFPVNHWLIHLSCLPSSPLPIRQRTEVHFHHGARECLAKIVFRDREILEPGKTAIAEVRFTSPIAAIYGDHCVLRAHSPLRAIGGGVVINPLSSLPDKRKPDYLQKWSILEELGAVDENGQLTGKSPAELLNFSLSFYPAPGVDLARLRVLTALPLADISAACAELVHKGEIFCWDENCWIGKEALETCLEKCKNRAQELHRRDPLKSSFAPNALISGWGEELPAKFVQYVLALAVERGILQQEGPGLKLAAHQGKLDPQAMKIQRLLTEKISPDNIAPPFLREIIEKSGLNPKKVQSVANFLCDKGELVKIQDGIYYHPEAVARIRSALMQWFAAHEELDISNLKSIIDISRKYAIPLLEYFDASRLTYRAGNTRRLRKNSAAE